MTELIFKWHSMALSVQTTMAEDAQLHDAHEEGHNCYLLSCARFSRLPRSMQLAQTECNHTMSEILFIILDVPRLSLHNE